MASEEDKNKKRILPFIARRKLLASGGSVMVALPKEWLEQHSLSSGDDVLVVASGSIKIIPNDKAVIEKLHKAVGDVKFEE